MCYSQNRMIRCTSRISTRSLEEGRWALSSQLPARCRELRIGKGCGQRTWDEPKMWKLAKSKSGLRWGQLVASSTHSVLRRLGRPKGRKQCRVQKEHWHPPSFRSSYFWHSSSRSHDNADSLLSIWVMLKWREKENLPDLSFRGWPDMMVSVVAIFL